MGIALKIVWPHASRWLSVGLYMATGWIALVAATERTDWFALVPLLLLAGGGLLYSAGGMIYVLRRPDPFPSVFGYHEAFHLLVIGGSLLHYSLVARYLMTASPRLTPPGPPTPTQHRLAPAPPPRAPQNLLWTMNICQTHPRAE